MEFLHDSIPHRTLAEHALARYCHFDLCPTNCVCGFLQCNRTSFSLESLPFGSLHMRARFPHPSPQPPPSPPPSPPPPRNFTFDAIGLVQTADDT
eukprot:2917888-Rhodomonas_salina.1